MRWVVRRVLWLPTVVLALWALGAAVAAQPDDSYVYIQVSDDEPDAGDAGAPDGGARDGGVDGGVDAGRPDAGPPVPVDAGHRFVERWFWADGGLYPNGTTDRVEVRVGRWVEVQFYRHAVLTVCDAPLVSVVGMGEAVRFFGLDAGATQCGFWLGQQQPFPDRLVDVQVYPANW